MEEPVNFKTKLASLLVGGVLGTMALSGTQGVASADGGSGGPKPPVHHQFCPGNGHQMPAMALAFSGLGKPSASCETNAYARRPRPRVATVTRSPRATPRPVTPATPTPT
jgi:hypothetical protein